MKEVTSAKNQPAFLSIKGHHAILIFDLNNETDRYDYECAIKATETQIAIGELYNDLRKIWKYEELNETQAALIERVRDIFVEHLGKLMNE
jgi:hypothetical protein